MQLANLVLRMTASRHDIRSGFRISGYSRTCVPDIIPKGISVLIYGKNLSGRSSALRSSVYRFVFCLCGLQSVRPMSVLSSVQFVV
jgi:hypothetical protein